MPNAAWAALAGFSAAFTGLAAGALLTYTAERARLRANRLTGVLLHGLLGISAGLLTAMISFGLLPPVLERRGSLQGFGWMAAGITCAMLLERVGDRYTKHRARLSMPFLAGIALHHFPEGVALGALLAASRNAPVFAAGVFTHPGFWITGAVALHCLPESLLLFIPETAGKSAHDKEGFMVPRIVTAALLAVPMAFGAWVGCTFGGFSAAFVDGCLLFAAGMILYIVCGEILPESGNKHTPAVRPVLPSLVRGLTITGAVVGFAAGVLLLLHR